MSTPYTHAKEFPLGDGIYVAWDGEYVWLRAMRAEGDHFVGLDPHVLREFERFLSETRKARLESVKK